MDMIRYAQDAIRNEAKAVAEMAERLSESFNRAVDAILNCKGRVIVTGMGKSGLVGRKIVATFNSTGISSFFLHPAEALHGDLGLIRSDDILMILSKSGKIVELEEIVAAAKRMEMKTIVLGGAVESPLYKNADIALDCSVSSEACPDSLVPTSSSTATLVMGDALAMALLKARNFTSADFAVLHPGGFLGHRLIKRVCEVHHTGEDIPLVQPETRLTDMMVEMTGKRLGCVLMKDESGFVAGIFTDGDLRRLLENDGELDMRQIVAADVMIKSSKAVNEQAVLDEALALMEKHSITQLPTVDDDGRLVGIIHLHDLLKTKLV